MQKNTMMLILTLGLILPACSQSQKNSGLPSHTIYKVVKTDEEWKATTNPYPIQGFARKGN